MKEISRYTRNDNAPQVEAEISVCGGAAATNAPLYYSKPVIPSRLGGEEPPAWKPKLSNKPEQRTLNLEPNKKT